MNLNYTRGRPFLMITYSRTPAGKSKEWDLSEKMTIHDRISTKQLIASDIVIDLVLGKVLKNRDGNPHAFGHYLTKYQDDISGAMKQWMASSPANVAFLQQITAERNEQNVKESAVEVEMREVSEATSEVIEE